MNRILTVLLSGLMTVSCGSKETGDSQSGPEMEVTQNGNAEEFNPEEIVYKGTYKGKINGKDVELTVKDETFDISVNGKRAHGSWQKVNDGSIMGLVPKSGTISVKNYAYSDPDTWVALTDSLTYYEPEQYLKRVK